MTANELEELKTLIEQQKVDAYEVEVERDKDAYRDLGYGGYHKRRLPNSDQQ